MPRVIKHPDLRKAELLDHSLRLFLERGFSNTSLNDVIAESDVSKGAFYHHFASKEDLLDALASRFAEQRLRALNLPPRKPKDTAVKRLNQVLASLRQLRIETIGIPDHAVAALFKPENQELYQRITTAWERIFRPVFAQVFIDGVKEGTFHTDDPEGVADLLLLVIAQGRSLLERVLDKQKTLGDSEYVRLIDRRAKLHGIMIDRLLGLKDGSVLTAEPGFGKSMLAKFNPSKTSPTKTPRSTRKG
jgi:AcrR family transcriptional regulator